MILGVTGTIGSGKGVFSSTLKDRYGFNLLTLGDQLRKELQRRRVTEDRTVLQRLGFEWKEQLAENIARQVDPKKNYVIECFRYPRQVEIVRRYAPMRLIAVDSFGKIRFERLKGRGRPGDPKTWEEFLIQDERDWTGFLDGSGQDVRGCFGISEYQFYNNGTLDEFKQSIDRFMGL